MTSAVLNNLEINATDFTTKEKCQDDIMSNKFSQILESKTTQNDNNTTNTKDQDTVADINASVNINANANTSTNTNTNANASISTNTNIDAGIQSNTENTNTENPSTNSIKESLIREILVSETEQSASNTISEISTIISDVLKEVTSELPVDFSLAQESDILSDTLINTGENTDIITENSTTEQNEDSQNTITNEDPTMNKEQILTTAPENLLTLSLIQTNNQILKLSDTNDSENIVQNSFSERNSDLKNENSLNLKEFKLPENQKDMLIMEDTLENDEVVVKTEGAKLRDIIDETVAEELNIETVEAEGNPTQQNSSDLMQNQTPQEQGIKAVLNGNIKFDDSNLNINTQIKNSSVELSAGKILEQISKQMENMHNGSKVNIVLNPEALGRVSLQLVNGKEGLIAQFSVTSQDVKDILMKGLAGLKESLLAQGVNVDNVSVKLTESTDSEYQGDWTEREGSQGGFKGQNSKHQKEDKKQFEKMMFEIENDGNV